MKLAFYKGRRRILDRLIQWWTGSAYSHVELVLSGPIAGVSECASSSMLDGGVRVKWIRLDADKWDVVELPGNVGDPDSARLWFFKHLNRNYDLPGLLGFVVPFRHHEKRWFCSEAVAESIGILEPHTYTPGELATIFRPRRKS